MKPKILIALLAGLVLLGACKGRNGSEEIISSNSLDTIAKSDSTTQSGDKLVKTAEMRLKVKNVQQTSEFITALTSKYRGLIVHQQLTSSDQRSTDVTTGNDSVMRVTAFTTTANITVKVPSEKLEEFMNDISHTGIYLNNRRMDISDKSLEYLSARLKLQNRNELVSQQKKGKVIIKNPANVLLLKDEMVDQQIGNRQIDDEVKNSIVVLSFYQSNTIYKETIANDNPAAYNLPFLKRLANALVSGWLLFEELLLGLANLWALILMGTSICISIKYYKKKRIMTLAKA
ncbi:DUF4349 domain-containing protein [Mucilaginibacter xinganensis]|uniref:DUF4349 domain-containing protein n=1 Tax=Mucilaginibacter xinganensis TaxID=1234841 RepID=A0A223NSP9_9SPHI|nr:DUF4349 domain-containing protein [Mucilaginibacter xinganensis]ASU32790.1 hypothetical protein MuYL_0890 [Mucilaginibacter xinganensis]